MKSSERPFHPEQWERLGEVRDRFQERSETDQPGYITEAIGDDGSVRIRPMTVTDLLDWVARVCEGDVS